MAQGGKARIDAFGIGREQGAVLRRHGGQDRCRAGAEAVHAARPVHSDSRRADQPGEFAGARAAQQIHLEKTFLRVDETQAARQILARGGGERGHAACIARDLDRRAEAGERMAAVQGRATGEQDPGAETCASGRHDDDRGGEADGGAAPDAAGFTSFYAHHGQTPSGPGAA